MTKSTSKTRKGNGAPNATRSSPPSVTKEKGKADMIAQDGGARPAPEGEGEKEAGLPVESKDSRDAGGWINGEPATRQELNKATEGSDEKAAA